MGSTGVVARMRSEHRQEEYERQQTDILYQFMGDKYVREITEEGWYASLFASLRLRHIHPIGWPGSSWALLGPESLTGGPEAGAAAEVAEVAAWGALCPILVAVAVDGNGIGG